MREVLKNRIWTASLKEAEALVAPEAYGRYAAHGISGVLTVAHDVRPRCVTVLPQLCLPVREDGRVPKVFFEMARQFQDHIGAVLIHCNAGVNRSRAFAVALMCAGWDIPLEDAIKYADAPETIVLRSAREFVLTHLAKRG